MKLRSESKTANRSGVILVVVLGALMFFSVLVATYLVFSSESRDASFAISQRNTRAPDADWIMNEALMTIVRGTDDPNNPFFGEDLLSDYYGHDGMDLQVKHLNAVAPGPMLVDDGFVRFPVSANANLLPPGVLAGRPAGIAAIDDVYAGLLVTFSAGPLQNRTYRVMRSAYRPAIPPAIPGNPTIPEYDDLFIELESGIVPAGTASQSQAVRRLFYADPNDLTTGGFEVRLNGVPRNSRGVGFDGNNIAQTTATTARLQQLRDPLLTNVPTPQNPPVAGFNLPIALQPNHLGRWVDKGAVAGDFDEDYDAPDFNNWFLGYRRPDGTVIPSFHRPAVINYILNERLDWASASATDYNNLMVNLSRATFRPLPIAEGQLYTGSTGPPALPASSAVNPLFTGGSDVYALRTALRLNGNQSFLDQLARGLIQGPWDVDNDKDGVADSVWIDLGLPVFASPEGKLLRPLVAPMIEDLGSRLSINAHGNSELSTSVAGRSSSGAYWAGTTGALNTQSRDVFRGIGWGPSDIMLPTVSSTGAIGNATIANNLRGLLNDRYRFGEQGLSSPDYAGADNHDFLDILRFGYRPEQHLAIGGFGYSTDPFGRGGLGMGRSGHILSAGSGTLIQIDDPMTVPVEPSVNEAVNNPYEIDPRGELSGDHVFTIADLESVLKSNEFDAELLPSQLRDRLQLLVTNYPEFTNVFTTRSTSDDQPSTVIDRPSPAGATTWSASTSYNFNAIVELPNGRFLRCIQPGQSGVIAPSRAGVDGTVRWDSFFPITPHTSIVDLLQILGVPLNDTDGMVAAEIRLGRKLDVNRPFGNLVDDNGNNIIDEPLETARRDANGLDDDADGVTDELGEVGEREAFRGRTAVEETALNSTDFGTPVWDFPNYTLDEPRSTVTINGGVSATPVANSIPVSGRQLLARHLYILAMALSRDLDNPTQEASFPITHPGSAGFTQAELTRLYKARRLAQWAVNVVDYRDPDSIMTRFVFDPDPFASDANPGVADHPFESFGPGVTFPQNHNGWSPPIDIYDPAAPTDPTRTKIAPRPFVVWGVEEPQLVFSESLAYHDVRLRDTNRDPSNEDKSGANPDEDSDQVRMPQGSLFLELYCPHATVSAADQATKPGVPQDLYTNAASLDLARTAPPLAGNVGAPVWRIGITERHDAGSPQAALDPAEVQTTLLSTASFDVESPDELVFDPTATPLAYDRFVWFRNVGDVAGDPDGTFNFIQTIISNNNLLGADATPGRAAERIFVSPFTPNANLVLQPGQFLLLAPRTTTHLGSCEFNAMYPGLPSDQRFDVAADGVIQFDQLNNRLTPALSGAAAPYAPAFPLVIGAPRPTGWPIPAAANPNLLQNVVGLNVSEPLPRGGNYYPQPAFRINGTQDVDGNGNEDFLLTDAYIDFSDPATQARDEPLDNAIGRLPIVASGSGGFEPALGTISRYCSAFLQRLADPTIPHDPVLNPYRNVDWISVDLNVFSGEDDYNNIVTNAPQYTRRSRQRDGHVQTATGTFPANALYSYSTNFLEADTAALDLNPVAGSRDDYFRFDPATGTNPTVHVQSSLSFLNTQTANNLNPAFNGFDASLGSQFAGVVGNDRNLPLRPYAVHPWLNRPFATHLELMMVPACSQARLFAEFSFDPTADPSVYLNAEAPATPQFAAIVNAPFRHLLNYFASERTDGSASGTTMELAKIFDYVHTLPRFRGEVDLINPSRLAVPPPGGPYTPEQQQLVLMRSTLAPPFAIQYDNQRQGTINLNTLSQFPVWAGLMQGHLNAAEFTSVTGVIGSADQLSFQNFVNNRRGYAVNSSAAPTFVTGAGPFNYAPGHLSPDFPTEFAGVFRSATFSPKAIQVRTNPDVMRRRAVNGTLLRGAGDLAQNNSPGAAHPSLFVRTAGQQPVVDPITAPTAVMPASQNLHHDRLRNAFMRYQTLMRMPNLVSDNSQVFLVRLTVGLFEVDAQTLSLQDEYNADIGRNQRYQATFVIDRSIPVGFKPGEDLNARDVVVFESYGQ